MKGVWSVATKECEHCEDHKVLTYQVAEILEILRSWGSLGRRILAGLVIALIIGAVGFVIGVEIHMSQAAAEQITAQPE